MIGSAIRISQAEQLLTQSRTFASLMATEYTKQQVEELEQYFNSVQLPNSIRLTYSEEIQDVKAFIASHIFIAREHAGSARGTFSAFYDRLVQLKKIISGEVPEPKYFQFRSFWGEHTLN